MIRRTILRAMLVTVFACFNYAQLWHGDTLTIHAVSFTDPSPSGWNAQYKTDVDFPTENMWAQILMVQTLKCDSATAGDDYPCGEWDYIWNTLLEVDKGSGSEVFSLGSFVTPYGKRLKLGGEKGWRWEYDITEYAPLLQGARKLIAGNNQELLDLKFHFIKGTPARKVLSVQNIYPYGEHKYEVVFSDSIYSEKEFVLNPDARGYRLKAVISGHGHAGPHNCCEWDSKTHTYLLNKWETYRWNVWKDCGDNPIYPQGGTWPFDRAGWCPGTLVDEYEFEITDKVSPGDTILIDYNIEPYRDNGEKDGHFRMSHQLFSFGPPNFDYDAAIVEIYSPSDEDTYSRTNPTCGAPRIRIRNGGRLPLRHMIIEYGMQGKRPARFKWQGELEFLEEETVTLPPLSPKKLKSSGIFEVKLILDKKTLDENPRNNVLTSIYQTPPELPDEFKLVVTTNNLGRAAENHWHITDNTGLAWYDEVELLDSTNYEYNISLEKGCYQFSFLDDMEDGVSVHWWYRNSAPHLVGTNGQIRIESVSGDTLKEFHPDFGERLDWYFVVR